MTLPIPRGDLAVTVAPVMWHETVHTHGFSHAGDLTSNQCPAIGYSMPYIIQNCVADAAKDIVANEFLRLVTLPNGDITNSYYHRPNGGELSYFWTRIATGFPLGISTSSGLTTEVGAWLEGPDLEIKSFQGTQLVPIEVAFNSDWPSFSATLPAEPVERAWRLTWYDPSNHSLGFRVHGAYAGKCVEVYPGSNSTHLYECFRGDRQRWLLVPAAARYQLKSALNNLCLSTTLATNGAAVVESCSLASTVFQFGARASSTSAYAFGDAGAAQCAEVPGVPGANAANGTSYNSAQCTLGPIQSWKIEAPLPVAPGTLVLNPLTPPRQLRNAATNKCIYMGSTSVFQWDCFGTPNEQFEVQPLDDGAYRISQGSKCLTRSNVGFAPFTCGNPLPANQRWRLLRSQ